MVKTKFVGMFILMLLIISGFSLSGSVFATPVTINADHSESLPILDQLIILLKH
jgi:hypothetical protein